MEGEGVRRGARAFAAALARGDADAMVSLFSTEDAAYADACRPGTSAGVDAVRAHLSLLCEALRGADVAVVDTLVDGDAACVRWMAQQRRDGGLALDGATWLRFRDGRIVDGRSFLDGALFLDAQREAAVLPSLDEARAPRVGEAVVLGGGDSRGRRFDMALLRGRVATVLLAGRAVQAEAHHLADLLGEAFGGDERVALVLVLDASEVPAALRGIARNALAGLRAQAVRRFREGFARRGRTPPPHVEDLVWFLLDEDGSHLEGLGAERPLVQPVLAVVDAEGKLRGVHAGSAEDIAARAVPMVRSLLA
jgi:ketosteroid isomerase-like protein